MARKRNSRRSGSPKILTVLADISRILGSTFVVLYHLFCNRDI